MTINLLEAKSKDLALLHSLSFEKCPPPYSEETFYHFLKDKNYHLSQEDNKGFAFARVIADTSELITLAVNPQFRRRGVAQKLLRQLIRKINMMLL